MTRTTAAVTLPVLLALAALGCSTSTQQANDDLSLPAGPVSARAPGAHHPPEEPEGLNIVAVPAVMREMGPIEVRESGPHPPGLVRTEEPVPALPGPLPRSMRIEDDEVTGDADGHVQLKVLDKGFLSTNFDDNGGHTGFVFIPPDPIAAAGMNHLVNVVNVTVRAHLKDGSPLAPPLNTSLKTFFTPSSPPPGYTPPTTYTFDPKVIYDQYEDRFVIVTLEKTDVVDSDPADTSRIFLAVSDDGDPSGTWYVTEWSSKLSIGSVERWADYPGFAVDNKAIYIAANMFGFKTTGGVFGGNRIWVVDKGTVGGFYAGSPATVLAPIDLFGATGNGGLASTTQPAHMFGTSPFLPTADHGTFFTTFSGLTDGLNEFLLVMRLENPLTAAVTSSGLVLLGNIDDLSGGLPDAPQSGSGTLIEVNDRRTLHSVYRNASLWVTTTINPTAVGPPANPEAGQTTAHWVEIDPSSALFPVVVDQGYIGGEQIATGTYTFFPSIAVTAADEVGIGFSASAATIFAGAYFTERHSGDTAGSTRAPEAVSIGTDFYVRTFGAPRNRWGDYSGTAVDPDTECFWAYNEYAMGRGTPISGEDGRWATAYGRFCPCTLDYTLEQNVWKMISLPCNPGGEDTVREVFGDELDPANYGDGGTWAVLKRDATIQDYVMLDIDDQMQLGEGYWIKDTETAKVDAHTVEVAGRFNTVDVDISLVTDAVDGRQNLVGHPFDFNVCWDQVRVVDGEDVMTIHAADPLIIGPDVLACDMVPPHVDCIVSRVGNIWNGNTYHAFDGVGPPDPDGVLTPMDAVWVKAFKAGVKLRILAQESCAGAPSPLTGQLVRLIASSGDMIDRGNILGLYTDARDGHDSHDIRELPPFSAPYLTIVFPHPEWGDFASDLYTVDLRAKRPGAGGIWDFEVRTDSSRTVTLSWEGSGEEYEELLARSRLIDRVSGRFIVPTPGGSTQVTVQSESHPFRWHVQELPPTPLIFADGFESGDTAEWSATVE